MKNFISLSVFLLMLSHLAYAQDPSCDCEIDPANYDTTVYLCPFVGTDPGGNPYANPHALVFRVLYQKTYCPAVGLSINVTGLIITTHWEFYNQADYISGLPPCDDMYPSDFHDFDAWTVWQNKMVAKIFKGAFSVTSPVIVAWRDGCAAFMRGRWPEGAYMSFTDEANGNYTQDVSNVDVSFTVPCPETTCCMIQVIDNTEWSIYLPNGACGGQAPDPNDIPKLFAQNENGDPVEFSAIITEVSECKPMCKEPWAFSAAIGKEEVEVELELKASPTPVESTIQIKSDRSIEKIMVFDSRGELVLEKKGLTEIDLSPLQTGIYFMQVYFKENKVKSIKLYKK